jgi:hypothetical protein
MKHPMNKFVFIIFITLSIMSISTAKEYDNSSPIDLSGIDESIFDTTFEKDTNFMSEINNVVSQKEINEEDQYIDLDFINPYDIGQILQYGENNSSIEITNSIEDPNFSNTSEIVNIEPATF